MQSELVKNDGGNMLDNDIDIYIEVSVRCWQGYIAIFKNGSIILRQEDSEHNQCVDDVADKIRDLISRGFDLFGLFVSMAVKYFKKYRILDN